MKKLLFLLLIPLVSFGQSWKYSEGGSAFDGKYKTSSIKCKGTNFPYTSPTLVVNKFEGENINFYISDGGFFQEKTGISVLWVFDNEPDTIYSTYDWSISNDGKILFFKEFNNPEGGSGKLKPIEIIEKLTAANEVTVRMKDNYGSNDIVFSLSGSTKAINFVISKEERDNMIELASNERKNLNEQEGQNQIILDKLLKIAQEEKLTSSSISSLESMIKRNLGMSYYNGMGTGDSYKSLKIVPQEPESMFTSYGYVDLYYILDDDSEKEVSGTYKVEMDAPLFQKAIEEKERIEKIKAEEKIKAQKNLKGIVSKYKNSSLQEHLIKKINDESESYLNKFSLIDLKDIKITFSGYLSYTKQFGYCKIDIYLNDGTLKNISRYLIDVAISKKDLKEIGGKENLAF